MAGKEETPKCRKKTVTWTNEMIEDLMDFIEIHPIVTFEAIYEPMLTSFWRLISFVVIIGRRARNTIATFIFVMVYSYNFSVGKI